MPPNATELAEEGWRTDHAVDASGVTVETLGVQSHRQPVRQAVKPVHYSKKQERTNGEST
jgi:hypothetical protein